VALLALNSELIDAPDCLDPPVCSDADDDKFLACAKAGGAEIVVSGDAALRAVSGCSGSTCSRHGSLLTGISRIISEARQSA
jgi:predicted nucleic acid-binding protein